MEFVVFAALGLGLEVDEVDEAIDPVETDVDVTSSSGLLVPKGGIVGLRQVARAFHDRKEVVQLELILALGAPDPRDEIEIDAEPPVRLVIHGGIPGDAAAAWSIVHAAPLLQELTPGLVTILDLPSGR
jgi:4-hydroxy-tetrahydrodipicolinate reductase